MGGSLQLLLSVQQGEYLYKKTIQWTSTSCLPNDRLRLSKNEENTLTNSNLSGLKVVTIRQNKCWMKTHQTTLYAVNNFVIALLEFRYIGGMKYKLWDPVFNDIPIWS